MGQTKSKEFADKKGTYNSSAQVEENDINIWKVDDMNWFLENAEI
jgi:hypothetical protein